MVAEEQYNRGTIWVSSDLERKASTCERNGRITMFVYMI